MPDLVVSPCTAGRHAYIPDIEFTNIEENIPIKNLRLSGSFNPKSSIQIKPMQRQHRMLQ